MQKLEPLPFGGAKKDRSFDTVYRNAFWAGLIGSSILRVISHSIDTHIFFWVDK